MDDNGVNVTEQETVASRTAYQMQYTINSTIASGFPAQPQWLDITENIVSMNSTCTKNEKYPTDSTLKYDPDSPCTNKDGYVKLPNVYLVKESTTLMIQTPTRMAMWNCPT